MNKKLKAVAVNPNGDGMNEVCKFLEENGYEIIGKSESGLKASELILDKKPDVVISDAYLVDVDFCGMTDILHDSKYDYPTVFVIATSILSGCVVENVLSHGADMFTLMPFDARFADEKIRALYEKKQAHTKTQTSIIDINDKFELLGYVSNLMHEVGVPASIRGYDYIRESIIMALDDREVLKSITKELYPSIAKNNSTTASRVERAIRHAVEVAWQRGDVDVLNGIFGYTVKSSKGKPTNGEFISMLAERVRLQLKIS